MSFIIIILISIYIFIKTLSYGLFEIYEKKNRTAGIVIISTSVLTLIATNIIIWFR